MLVTLAPVEATLPQGGGDINVPDSPVRDLCARRATCVEDVRRARKEHVETTPRRDHATATST